MLNFYVVLMFVFAIVSGTVMSLCFKVLANYSAYLVTGVAGLVTGLGSLLIWYVLGESQSGSSSFHWVMILLGLAIIGINVAYALLYTAKVPTAYAPIIVTAGMTIMLGICGRMIFNEAITWQFVLGVLVILTGMIIVVA